MTTPTRKQGWHPERVKAELRIRGWTMRRIGRHCGFAYTSAPGKVFVQPWPAMEKLLAEILGVPPHRIWPERYRRDGTSRATARTSYALNSTPGNSKDDAAA